MVVTIECIGLVQRRGIFPARRCESSPVCQSTKSHCVSCDTPGAAETHTGTTNRYRRTAEETHAGRFSLLSRAPHGATVSRCRRASTNCRIRGGICTRSERTVAKPCASHSSIPPSTIMGRSRPVDRNIPAARLALMCLRQMRNTAGRSSPPVRARFLPDKACSAESSGRRRYASIQTDPGAERRLMRRVGASPSSWRGQVDGLYPWFSPCLPAPWAQRKRRFFHGLK